MIFYQPAFISLMQRVSIGSIEHILPITLAIIFAIVFIKYSKQHFSKAKQEKAIHFFAIFVSLTVAVFHVYHITKGNYDIKVDLPLYLCSLIALLIPVFTYYKKYWMYEILVFWIIAGTTQGVITPDIADGFPAFDYFRYWVVHLGLLIIIFYITFVFNMRPKLKSVFKSFLALQVYVVIIILINYILKANYFYLNAKPQSASVLDYLGDWPYYILVAETVLIPYFLLIYLPFYVFRKYDI